jgi:hypothetical protein
MGAWGAGAFENDTACDWSYGLEDVDDLSLVESALKAVVDEEEYIEADACCEALAACEVVARLLGKPGVQDSYTETVDAWVKAHPIKPTPAQVKLALRAIEAVGSDRSELRELWDGDGDWVGAVEDLKRRISS